MATTDAWEVMLSKIYAGYLSDAPAVAAGLPTVEVAPRYDMEHVGEVVRPSFEVAVTRLACPHPRLVRVQVDIAVRTMGPDEIGEGGTAPAVAAQWAKAARVHVSDITAFVAYLMTAYTPEQRTGWRILKLWLVGEGSVELDAETRARDEKVSVLVWMEVAGG